MKLRLLFGLMAVLMAPSTSVRAEISAQDVLGKLREISSAAGQTLTIGSEEMVGDTLVLSSYAVSIAMPSAKVSVKTDWIKMQETGGSVKITTAPTSALHIGVEPNDGPMVDITGQSKQDGLVILVSGNPNEMSFNIAADRYDFSLQKVSVQQMLLDIVLDLKMTQIAADYALTQNDTGIRRIEGSYTIAKLAMDMDFKIPGGTDFVLGTASAEDLNLDFAGDVPDIDRLQSLADSNQNPLQMMDIAYQGSGKKAEFDFRGKIDGATGRMKGDYESYSAGLDILPELFAFGFSYIGGGLSIASSELPFPEVGLNFEEIAFDLVVPLAQSEAPSDTSIFLALREIEVSDFLWDMVDPEQNLPRDPATAVIDISGKVAILVDIMDLAEIAGIDAPPVAPLSVDLNELLLSFAGATLDGEGAFVFDNSDLETYDGFPRPVGKLDLSLKGAYGLLDNLMALDLVPTDALFFIRTMIGAFSTTGGEPDHFVTVVEMTPDGGITANGQRVK